jgi:hypothetical protein
MSLNKKQIEFFNKKQQILDKTKDEIRAIILTALKINNNYKNKEKLNFIFDKYLAK